MNNSNFFDKLAELNACESVICALNSNQMPYPKTAFPTMIAAGTKQIWRKKTNDNHTHFFDQLNQIKNTYLFGYLGYDLKNEVEQLSSQHPDNKGFDDAFLFEPKQIFHFPNLNYSNKNIESGRPDNPDDYSDNCKHSDTELVFKSNFSRAAYIEAVEQIQALIGQGIVYELNFCMEFVASGILSNPLQTYKALCGRAPAPFSVFLKIGHLYMLGASPERFLRISSDGQMLSQPIKGTSPRNHDCTLKDLTNRFLLQTSQKEQAENLMITDLVRNDLAKTASIGSVKIAELFGIYGFSHVWQMISSVQAQLDKSNTVFDALKAAFPMGSMSGMPKISALNQIEKLEKSKRGIFSGATGYIDPSGNMDFNVNIRSLFYNQASQTLCFQAGSAITIDSDPAKEFDECLLKANHLIELLEAKLVF